MKKAFLCILGSVLLLLAAVWGGIRYRTRYEVVLLDSSFSPDGEYTLTLASVGEPDWPFGSARGRITLKQNEKQLSRTEIDIADDGCQLGKEHWSIVWQDTHAAVTLRASEQPDEHWRFYFDGQVLQLPGLPAAAAPTQRPRTQEAGGTPASEERVTLPDPAQSATEEARQAFLAESRALGSLYRDIYLEAEKTPSQYLGAANALTQPWKDRIEAALASAGCPVLNSDSVYPAFLENAAGIHAFWESAAAGNDAHTGFWEVSPEGGLFYTGLSLQDGKQSCIYASAEWGDGCELMLAGMEQREIYFWDMTQGGDFYYQDLPLNRHWDATRLIRLHPADPALYDLYLRHIAPVGYHNVNLFLLDWDRNDHGDVCFNDLLGGLYRADHGSYLDAQALPYAEEPWFHCLISAQLFEETILPHFDIPLDEFRQRTLYDPESGTYPWQDIMASNVSYYPTVIPEVTAYTPVCADTFELTVRVMCTDYHSDHVLTHVVTIQEQPEGGWLYLGNRVTDRDEVEQPSPRARIEAQRTRHSSGGQKW